MKNDQTCWEGADFGAEPALSSSWKRSQRGAAVSILERAEEAQPVLPPSSEGRLRSTGEAVKIG